MTLPLAALLAQTAAAWFGAGFIWTMQVLNYPLLELIGPESFRAYETAHNQRFIRVVGPGILVTAVATVLLLVAQPAGIPFQAAAVAAILFLLIVVSTAIYGAPAHARLANGFDAGVHRRLVRSNWSRVLAWTLLGLLDLWMLSRVLT